MSVPSHKVAVVVSSCLDSTPTLPVDHVRVSVGIGHRDLSALVCVGSPSHGAVPLLWNFLSSPRAALIFVRANTFVCLGQRDGSTVLLRAQHIDDALVLQNTQLLFVEHEKLTTTCTSPRLTSPAR